MLKFNQVADLYVEKIRGESKATNCRTDPIPSKLIKKFKVYFTPFITTLNTYHSDLAHLPILKNINNNTTHHKAKSW